MSTETTSRIICCKYERNMLGYTFIDIEKRQIMIGRDSPDTATCDFLKTLATGLSTELLLISLHMPRDKFLCLKDAEFDTQLALSVHFRKYNIPEKYFYGRNISLMCLKPLLNHIEQLSGSFCDISKVNMVEVCESDDKKMDFSRVKIGKVSDFSVYLHENTAFMYIDIQSVQSLRLINQEKHPNVGIRRQIDKNCLFSKINFCSTAGGALKLKEWLLFPLTDANLIEKRRNKITYILKHGISEKLCSLFRRLKPTINFVKYFVKSSMLMYFTKIYDFIRISREILQMLDDFYEEPEFKQLELEIFSCFISNKRSESIIAKDYNEELDLALLKNTKLSSFLDEVANRVAKELQVELSIVYFPQIGYTIESFTRISDFEELFQIESNYYYKNSFMYELDRDLGDVINIVSDLEMRIFLDFKTKIDGFKSEINKRLRTLEEIDCLNSLSKFALTNNLTKPQILHEKAPRISLKSFIDLTCPNEEQIPTSISVSKTTIITGDNGSGKSTLLRCLGVSVILNQMGSYVSGTKCELSIFDKIYTKMLCKESLSLKRSAFVSDLIQVGNAVKFSSESSLFLCDEFGKGTNIYDGVSLLVSLIHNFKHPLCIYVTHYQDIFNENIQEYLKDYAQYTYNNHRLEDGLECEYDIERTLKKLGFESDFIEQVLTESKNILSNKKEFYVKNDQWATDFINNFIRTHLKTEINADLDKIKH